jgi:hypothetical protein
MKLFVFITIIIIVSLYIIFINNKKCTDIPEEFENKSDLLLREQCYDYKGDRVKYDSEYCDTGPYGCLCCYGNTTRDLNNMRCLISCDTEQCNEKTSICDRTSGTGRCIDVSKCANGPYILPDDPSTTRNIPLCSATASDDITKYYTRYINNLPNEMHRTIQYNFINPTCDSDATCKQYASIYGSNDFNVTGGLCNINFNCGNFFTEPDTYTNSLSTNLAACPATISTTERNNTDNNFKKSQCCYNTEGNYTGQVCARDNQVCYNGPEDNVHNWQKGNCLCNPLIFDNSINDCINIDTSVCKNGGQANTNDGSCICITGYSGKYCECDEGAYSTKCITNANAAGPCTSYLSCLKPDNNSQERCIYENIKYDKYNNIPAAPCLSLLKKIDEIDFNVLQDTSYYFNQYINANFDHTKYIFPDQIIVPTEKMIMNYLSNPSNRMCGKNQTITNQSILTNPYINSSFKLDPTKLIYTSGTTQVGSPWPYQNNYTWSQCYFLEDWNYDEATRDITRDCVYGSKYDRIYNGSRERCGLTRKGKCSTYKFDITTKPEQYYKRKIVQINLDDNQENFKSDVLDGFIGLNGGISKLVEGAYNIGIKKFGYDILPGSTPTAYWGGDNSKHLIFDYISKDLNDKSQIPFGEFHFSYNTCGKTEESGILRFNFDKYNPGVDKNLPDDNMIITYVSNTIIVFLYKTYINRQMDEFFSLCNKSCVPEL